jgi:hypothetical protein
MQVLKHSLLLKTTHRDTCERATFRHDPSLVGNWTDDSLFAQTFAHDCLETEAIPFWGVHLNL